MERTDDAAVIKAHSTGAISKLGSSVASFVARCQIRPEMPHARNNRSSPIQGTEAVANGGGESRLIFHGPPLEILTDVFDVLATDLASVGVPILLQVPKADVLLIAGDRAHQGSWWRGCGGATIPSSESQASDCHQLSLRATVETPPPDPLCTRPMSSWFHEPGNPT
jgi:hypothetical protein